MAEQSYPWDILPELLRMGMVVLEVIQGAGAETVMIVEMPEGMMAKRQSKLSVMLNEKLKSVGPGAVARLTLGGGMNIDMVFWDGMFRLQVSRDGKSPSDTEWKTTLKNLAYALEGEPDERFEVKGRCYLRSAWPVAELKLKEVAE